MKRLELAYMGGHEVQYCHYYPIDTTWELHGGWIYFHRVEESGTKPKPLAIYNLNNVVYLKVVEAPNE